MFGIFLVCPYREGHIEQLFQKNIHQYSFLVMKIPYELLYFKVEKS